MEGVTGMAFRTGITFRSFLWNYVSSMVNAARKDRVNGKRHLGVIGRSWAYSVLYGGIGVYLLDDALDILEQITGIPFRRNMKSALKRTGGKMLETFGHAGIPGLLGGDISGSLKIGIPQPIPYLVGAGGSFANELIGVWSGLINKGQRAIDKLMDGEYLRALENSSPMFIENALKGYRLAKWGDTDKLEKTRFDSGGEPMKLNPVEGLAQGVGFRPERMSEESARRREINNQKAYGKRQHDNLMERYRLAHHRGRESEMNEYYKRKEKFNAWAATTEGRVNPISQAMEKNWRGEKPDKDYMENTQ